MPFLHLLTRRNGTLISRGNLQPSAETSESRRSTWIFSRKRRGVGGAVTPPSLLAHKALDFVPSYIPCIANMTINITILV